MALPAPLGASTELSAGDQGDQEGGRADPAAYGAAPDLDRDARLFLEGDARNRRTDKSIRFADTLGAAGLERFEDVFDEFRRAFPE
jgi:hypothetical protein